MMRRVSANNHQGQEDKSFQQQAGYMRAMISSHINVEMSCKRSGSIYAGKGREPGAEAFADDFVIGIEHRFSQPV
jgi:hypothetical protein